MSGLMAQTWRELDPEFLERILQRVDVDGMVDAVADEVSELVRATWTQVDEATLTSLRLTTFAGMSEFLREASHPDTASDRLVFRTHGRAQQQSGRTIEEMLALYQLVGLGLWRHTSAAMQEAQVSLSELSAATSAFFAYMSELAGSAAEGYVAAGLEAARGSQARRDRLMEVLLEDPPPDDTVIMTAARAAGWIPPPALAVLVTEAHLDAGLLEALPQDVLTARVGDHTVIVTPGDPGRHFLGRITAAVGPNRAGLGAAVEREAIRSSYQSATALLTLATRRGDSAGTILELPGNEVDLMVLADERLAAGLADSALRPLTAVPSARRHALIATLAAWLTQPDQPLAIARDLHVHVQTVRYRVRQLRELLGDAIDDPEERPRLILAVRAHTLLRGTSG